MPRNRRTISLVIAVTGLLAAGCGSQAVLEATGQPPAVVEPIDGAAVQRVTLSDHAAQRIGIETAPVTAGDGGRSVVPAAAVLYDASGKTWVYTNPVGHVFVRAQIGIAQIKGDKALLSLGPAPDTLVVTVGVAELYGAETGVGDHE